MIWCHLVELRGAQWYDATTASYRISVDIIWTVRRFFPSLSSLSLLELGERRTMVSSSFSPLLSANFTVCGNPNNLHAIIPSGCNNKHTHFSESSLSSSSSLSFQRVIHKAVVPLAASVTVLLSPVPGKKDFFFLFLIRNST